MIRTRRVFAAAFSLSIALGSFGARAGTPALEGLDALYPELDRLYMDLHQNPELSLHEEKTSAKMADQLRRAGYEVTEHVGGFGVVGVMKNGAGPTVLIRTDMDALPVKEQTEIAYASTVVALNDAGESVPVMHACGHDVHMTSWVGAARMLAGAKERWRGTLVFVGQPAEEGFGGASRMVADGLLTRFPKPDFALGIHVDTSLPAGQVGVVSGPAFAASDSVDITFFGVGGHGARPQATVDPLVIAARAVGALQTIVSREVDPFDAAVVTVGTFHAGLKRNVISDEARLELTVRSYKPEVQKKLLASIERIAKGEAAAGNSPREPRMMVHTADSTEAVVNDPVLAGRLMKALQSGLGEGRAVVGEATMGAEDFGVYGRAAGVPGVQLRVGAVEPEVYGEAKKAGRVLLLPGLHSARFTPDRERTIRTGTAAFVISAMEVLGAGKE